MKNRNGFVSNSSSSSFVCSYCGAIESGYSCSLEDFEMVTCEHGHEFHIGHSDKESILRCLLDSDFENCSFIRDYIDFLRKQINNSDSSKIYDLEEKKDFLEILVKYNEGKEVDFCDYMYYVTHEWGVPESYCPVCKRNKDIAADPDWIEYKKLYMKFGGVNPK